MSAPLDRLDWILLSACVLGFWTFFYGLLRLIWRRPRGPGGRLARQGATRIILRNFTRGGDFQRWN